MGVLSGRSVVVTGAGRGLGRAYALHAAASGAAVVVNDVDEAAAESVAARIREDGGSAVSAAGSVADADAAARIVDRCTAEFGGVDGLVNNAGIFHRARPWEEDLDRIRSVVEVNVLGTVHCGLAAVARMREQGSPGSVVNVTSGTHLGHPETAVYGATKGAVASLTYGWALDLMPLGIRVNAVSPLAVTDMKLPPYEGHAAPEEVAAVVTFLLSDKAHGITGQVVRRARRGLGLMRHPDIGEMAEADRWEVEEIDGAFRDALGPLQPVGYGAHRAAPEPSGAAHAEASHTGASHAGATAPEPDAPERQSPNPNRSPTQAPQPAVHGPQP
ncbi:SDR family oxidoreductase [Streptomyces sp. HNM0575]|uniref:SDR family NAD(P)-dependent oxidoreductase n=1 Tax=Streptomyces sp. HNM0575 TaxID=2716338 RepID=UPI0019CF56A1|nr:SDR family oxidoreductase [Streptomyces sp. HNM0575]